MNLEQNVTAERFAFLVIDASVPLVNLSRFRNNLLERI